MKTNDCIIASVIIMTYNHEKYIKQAIEGVINQKTDFAFEILVNDDASTDGSRAVINQIKDLRIKKFFRRRNIGATKGMYSLIKRARGKYLFIFDGDDYWIDNEYMQRAINFLNENPQFGGYSCRRLCLKGERRTSANVLKRDRDRVFTLKDLLKGETFDVCATAYRNIFSSQNSDLYLLYKGDRIQGDLTLAILFLERQNLYLSDDIIGIYRCGNRKGESNFNTIFSSWEMYIKFMHIIKVLNRTHKNDYSIMVERRTYQMLQEILTDKRQLYLLNKLSHQAGIFCVLKCLLQYIGADFKLERGK